MFQKTFAKHFSSLTDVRMVPDPWGIGFTVPILRENHDDWKTWLKENQGKSSVIDLVTKAGIKAMLTRQLTDQQDEEEGKAGYRKKKRLTHAQRVAQQKKRAAAIDVTQIIERSVDALPSEELSASLSRDLNAFKPGVALVLMSDRNGVYRWEGVTDDNTGEPVPYTLQERLRFLGWRGFYVVVPSGLQGIEQGDHFLSVEEHEQLDPASSLGKAIASGAASVEELTGNPLDEQGGMLWVSEDQLYGPGPVGDCLTEWALEECAETEAFHVRFVGGAAQDLSATPNGESATSAS